MNVERSKMPAALLWAYSAENDFKLSDTGQPAGCPVSHFHQRGRKGKRHLQRLFPAETAALWMGCPLDVTSPFVKKQFRNARRRFGTAFLREGSRRKTSQAYIRSQPPFCAPKGCARAFLEFFGAIRCISGAIHAELHHFCRRSWYTTSTEQCSVQYAIPIIPIEQKTVR